MIAALICCPLAGLILGILALNNAKTSRNLLGREEPDAKTARTLGILAIVFAALGFVANLLVTMLQLLEFLPM